MANGIMDLPQGQPQMQPQSNGDNGIMDLPQGQPQMQQLSSADTYDAATTALGTVNPAQLEQYKAAIQQAIAQLQLEPEQIAQMIQVFEYLVQNKEQYPQVLQQLIQQGVLEAGDLPEQFDAQLIGVVLAVLHEMQSRDSSQQMQAPSQFAEGGLADAARYLQNQGRNGDTILAHINPQEAMMLKQMGGAGTINPHTGLPEFGFNLGKIISNAVKSVVNVAKDIVSSPIGQIVGTIALATVLGPWGLGLSMPIAAGLAGAGTSLLAGGDLKSALVSGALGYFGGGGGIGGFNPSQAIQGMIPGGSALLGKVLTGAAIGTAGGLLQGKTIGESLGQGIKGAAMSGITAAAQGALPASTSGPQAPAPVSDAVPSVNSSGAVAPVETASNLSAPAAPAPAQMYNAVDSVEAAAGQPMTAPEADPIAISKNDASIRSDVQGRYDVDAYKSALNAAQNGTYESPARTGIETLRDAASTVKGYTDTASDYLFRAGDTQAQVDARAAEAGESRMDTLRLRNPNATPQMLEDAYQKGVTEAQPGMLAKYGPTAAILGGAAVLGGAGKPVPVQKQPLYKPQTGQDYINANPQLFDKYKSFGEPGVAAPTVTGFVPTTGPQPQGLYSLQSAPLYTPPAAAVSGGQPLNQPYNSAGMYRIPVYNRADGGSINNPMFSGTHPTGMTSAFASGGNYPRRSGAIAGKGTGTSDSIPAMLSDGEFVFTAKAVRNAGGGSRRAGAKKMYQLMQKLERGGKVRGA